MMKNRVFVLSYYHPWISGGGHRPVCLVEQDIINNKQVMFCFESVAEIDTMETFPLHNQENLFVVRRDPVTGYTHPCNKSSANIFTAPLSDSELLLLWQPSYIRSHNPVEGYIPLLNLCQEMGIIHIYDQMDFWDAFPVQPWGKTTEETYIQFSDACVTVSKWLQRRHPTFHIVPNAIKDDFLSKIYLDFDAVLKRSSEDKKRIIYCGAIWPDWFDWQIVENLIKKRPEYEFLFVGPYIPSDDEDDHRNVAERVNQLAQLNNVAFTGQLSHEEIIPFLQSAHVGIVPFKVNDITEACSPLKCYEYAGACLPIVSVPLPEIESNPMVKFAYTAEDFVNKIDESVQREVQQQDYDDAYKFSYRNTWSERMRYFDSLVRLVIQAK